MQSKVATLIRIDEDIFDELKEIANEENRSFNKQVEFILKNYIDHYKEEIEEEEN